MTGWMPGRESGQVNVMVKLFSHGLSDTMPGSWPRLLGLMQEAGDRRWARGGPFSILVFFFGLGDETLGGQQEFWS